MQADRWLAEFELKFWNRSLFVFRHLNQLVWYYAGKAQMPHRTWLIINGFMT